MDRDGPLLLDADAFWDIADDLGPMAGVELALAGCLDATPYLDETPILSIEETAAHLDDGNFNRVFDILRTGRHSHTLCIFVVLCMRVGAKISQKHIKYIKRIYEKVDAWEHLPESREQIRVACEEYESGKPYEFKETDFGADRPNVSDDGQAMEAMRVGLRDYHQPSKPMKHCPDCAKSESATINQDFHESGEVDSRQVESAKTAEWSQGCVLC